MAVTITNDAATTRTNLGLGDAATKTVGTASGNIPVLDSSGQIADAQLAALAASKLTGIKTVGGVSIAGSGDIATLPSGGTANQVLTSDASGTGTWEDAAAGGKVLQVVQATKTDHSAYTFSAGTWVTMGGFTATITPTLSTSKILVAVTVQGNAGARYIGFKLYRNSTQVGMGDARSSASRVSVSSDSNNDSTNDYYMVKNAAFSYLDSPTSIAALSYTVKVGSDNNSATFKTNTTHYDGGQAHDHSTLSSIILMEIGA